jgi:hypothetical protein
MREAASELFDLIESTGVGEEKGALTEKKKNASRKKTSFTHAFAFASLQRPLVPCKPARSKEDEDIERIPWEI